MYHVIFRDGPLDCLSGSERSELDKYNVQNVKFQRSKYIFFKISEKSWIIDMILNCNFDFNPPPVLRNSYKTFLRTL